MTGRENVAVEVSALLRRHRRPCVVTVGTFDGVHAGHRAVVAHARETGMARGLRTVAVTFSPRPDAVLAPRDALPDVVPVPERMSALRDAGANDVVILPFTRELAAMSAEQFTGLLVCDLGMRVLCVGADFALGRGREGTVVALRGSGLEVIAVPLVVGVDGKKLSSEDIRRAIAHGSCPDDARRAA
jgi:riboflavin kinase/FMN adenylyltransferase